jgi:type I site-specific restriction-modification system R (restriction) subunit
MASSCLFKPFPVPFARLNPKLPREASDEALRQVLQENPARIQSNRRFHELLADSVEV